MMQMGPDSLVGLLILFLAALAPVWVPAIAGGLFLGRLRGSVWAGGATGLLVGLPCFGLMAWTIQAWDVGILSNIFVPWGLAIALSVAVTVGILGWLNLRQAD